MFPIGQGTRVWGRLEGFQEQLSPIPVKVDFPDATPDAGGFYYFLFQTFQEFFV